MKTLIRISGKIVLNPHFFWTELVLNPLTIRESEMVCSWLKQCMSEPDVDFKAAIKDFFTVTFRAGSATSIPESAFDTFQAMMCGTNVYAHFFK